MATRAEERKAELIAALVALAQERLAAGEAGLAVAFLQRYWRDVAPADILARDVLDLYGSALAHLRFGQRRQPGETKVRAYNPDIERHGWQSTHTVIEVVHDDMPFLVDSVSMELNRHGLGIHLVIHPVVRCARDAAGELRQLCSATEGTAESFMHFEVDRQSDPELLARVAADLSRVLTDVRHAVADWREMRAAVTAALGELRPRPDSVPAAELDEIRAFLDWLVDDHFTFLGYGAYRLDTDAAGSAAMLLDGPALGILRGREPGYTSRSFSALPAEVRARATDPTQPLIVTKANTRSTVHRATWLDFIGIKRYGAEGQVVGEHRFLGLFTSAAYNLNPRQIPLLRRKVDTILARSGFNRTGHAGKALANILDTYPRDELFQTDEARLFDIALAILHIQDRQRIRLFVRPDPFGRFVSCIVYVPRERYNTGLRERMQAILEATLSGRDTQFQAQVSEAVLARILFVVRTPNGIPGELDAEALEAKLVEATHGWTDQLKDALLEAEGEEDGNRLFLRFGRHFPSSYQERVSARAAVADIERLDALDGQDSSRLAMTLYRRIESPPDELRFKLIRPQQPVLLSDVLPILENMGLQVLTEEGHTIRLPDGGWFAMHDFALRPLVGDAVELDRIRIPFQEVFAQVWAERLENDGFNRLVLAAGLDARQIAMLRAYCKYMLQIGSPFSQAYIEATLVANPPVARGLAAYFAARFDPARDAERAGRAAALRQEILAALEQVQILDEDRILRRYLELIEATLRTNAFQLDPASGAGKDYLSVKLDPHRIPGMPRPLPAYEIFVYAPWMEGVHLRGGKVARGGLRWSDRREDFRTEVLGLMKAQMVKNSVIVPVGAKGGFIVKRPPKERAALLEEGIRCYKTLLRGMLDITDNSVQGQTVPPPDVVRYDDDDPYLVVAADKGTATFSDIANGVSAEYGFWLGDAFASGGSAGYDHKGMAITARGAWESVRRHFRELGMDPDTDPFTVVGIGDMSGDVFGNGMLLSRQIKLVAAFDHRHIFLDPNPDPAISFAERKRLFDKPRSSWDDYDRALISEGGGVWPRTAKSIPLSPAAQAALGTSRDAATPSELMHAILRAPVDLLWNGGIGTYVKAAAESHAEAQDRANDAIRADGETLRCKVVGEGGNLGFTQKGRIAYALNGGRINTDFIDNSAGVDCSDHEVNIKILLGEVVQAGDLTLKQRDQILAEMTDEVATLVLRDNILQNLALSLSQSLGVDLLDAHWTLMRKLEAAGRLDRELERLPSDAELTERRKAGRGLTRPESAVLLAYSKMTLYDDLLRTELPDRVYFNGDLAKYFPRLLRRRFPQAIEGHRLRREIVATWIANSLINRGLEVFVSELEDETGADLADIALAFVITRDAFKLLPLWHEIETLRAPVPADQQLRMLLAVRHAMFRGTRWFLSQLGRPLVIRDAVGRFGPGVARVADSLEAVLQPDQAQRLDATIQSWASAGIDLSLARRVALLPHLATACDIVALSAAEDDLAGHARTYSALDAELGMGQLDARLAQMHPHSRWERMAIVGLQDELSQVRRQLTGGAAAAGVGGPDPAAAAASVRQWLGGRLHGISRYRTLLDAATHAAEPDLAMMSVVVRALVDLGRMI